MWAVTLPSIKPGKEDPYGIQRLLMKKIQGGRARAGRGGGRDKVPVDDNFS